MSVYVFETISIDTRSSGMGISIGYTYTGTWE
jgi:hypothetical protein